jgi:tetratricopeptide (TPR) repeat protein
MIGPICGTFDGVILMNNRKLIIYTLFIFILIAVSYGLRTLLESSAAPAATESQTISIPLERQPIAKMAAADAQIDFWQARAQRDPHDYISLTYLGQAYVNKARETGNEPLYLEAETILRQALRLNPTYDLTLAYLGGVQMAKHDFATAIELAQSVYDNDTRAIHALATIGDASLEIGQYAEAVEAYQMLADQAASAPVSARMARLAWIEGRPDDAIALMAAAATEAESSGLTGEAVAWYQFQLGELHLNTGQLKLAETHYQAALGLFKNYYLPQLGLGKVYAARGEFAKAIAQIEAVTAVTPHPELFGLIGDYYLLQGDHTAAAHYYEMVDQVAQSQPAGLTPFDRHLMLYNLNHDLHLADTLALAEAELKIRQDVYGYDMLAWALYKNGRFTEAATMIEKALRQGTQEPFFLYHAGMIHAANGNIQQATLLLTEALTLNPYFDLLQADIAHNRLTQLSLSKH